MIRTFRPWQLFEHLGDDNKVSLMIPTIPGTESLTIFALETELLITAARIVQAKSILEIGTSLGYTALHLARNTQAQILTIDIAQKPSVFAGTPEESRIKRFTGTAQAYHMLSCAWDDQPQFDFVFIDADHSYEAVKMDTETALKFSPKVIAWHDYDNPLEIGVKRYLMNDFARDHDIIHVADSWMAFWFREDLK